MIRSIFTRDGQASSYDMAVPGRSLPRSCKFGEEVPTGTYLDMTAHLPLVDPKKVQSPVLLFAASTTEFDRRGPVRVLSATAERRPPTRVLPHTAHGRGGINRHLLWYATRDFLAAPAAVAAS